MRGESFHLGEDKTVRTKYIILAPNRMKFNTNFSLVLLTSFREILHDVITTSHAQVHGDPIAFWVTCKSIEWTWDRNVYDFLHFCFISKTIMSHVLKGKGGGALQTTHKSGWPTSNFKVFFVPLVFHCYREVLTGTYCSCTQYRYHYRTQYCRRLCGWSPRALYRYVVLWILAFYISWS